MAVYNEDVLHKEVLSIAKKMMVAITTAPKGRGKSNLLSLIVTGDDIIRISDKMKELSDETGQAFFERDANNILSASALLIVATKIEPLGLKKCGLCGFAGCEEKLEHPKVPCAFNTGDLGIAIGSAVSVATDHRVDNRIMYTVGQAIIDMNFIDSEYTVVYGIPLSATAKNPFFDRK